MSDQSLAPYQPPLFCEFEDDPKLVARAKDFIHTGKIRGRDAGLVAEVVRWVLAGVSHSRIAARFGISRNTVVALMRVAEESGKLEQEKARLAAGFVDIATLCSENFRAKLLAGEVPANVLMVSGGIAVDKALLLTGQATQITEHKRGVDQERAGDWIERLRAVRESITLSAPQLGAGSLATDGHSVVVDAQPAAPQAGSGVSISSNADLVTPDGSEAPLATASADPLPAVTLEVADEAPAGTPGGGVAPREGGANRDRLPSAEFCPKELPSP